MIKNKGIFPQSKDLKKIIEDNNWTLYDLSNPPEGRAYTWEEMDKMTPAVQYEIGHNYFFIPIRKDGQTLRQAYTPTKGLGPSLMMPDSDDGRFLVADVGMKPNGLVALFTRLFMHEEFAFVTSPKTAYLLNPDLVAIQYDYLIGTFKKYFRIIPPEEYGLKTPIPMPYIMN
jgi:hypothetical protein